jgi:hypothetical protein
MIEKGLNRKDARGIESVKTMELEKTRPNEGFSPKGH